MTPIEFLRPTPAVDIRACCEQVKQRIERLCSKMRQGYSARQGIRMDEQMRRLKKSRRKYCR